MRIQTLINQLETLWLQEGMAQMKEGTSPQVDARRAAKIEEVRSKIIAAASPEQPQGQVGVTAFRNLLNEMQLFLSNELAWRKKIHNPTDFCKGEIHFIDRMQNSVADSLKAITATPQPNVVKLAIEALKFYANVNHWEQGIASGSGIAGAEDGEPFMAFSKGKDHPWTPAKEALTALSESSETRDGARLDWLDANESAIDPTFKEGARNIREAIDAAMRNDGGAV